MKREIFATACAGVAGVMAVGFSGTAAAAPPDLVPVGKLSSIIQSADVVSGIIGSPLTNEKTYATPFTLADYDHPECAVLDGLNSDSFGDDYDAFKLDIQNDDTGNGNGSDHVVIQNAGIYGDADTPTKLFHDAFQSVSGCDALQVKYTDGSTTSWQLKPAKVTDSQATWVMVQLDDNGKPFGWRCGHDARVQDNVIIEAEVCQFGNPARIATQLADQMTASFSSSASS